MGWPVLPRRGGQDTQSSDLVSHEAVGIQVGDESGHDGCSGRSAASDSGFAFTIRHTICTLGFAPGQPRPGGIGVPFCSRRCRRRAQPRPNGRRDRRPRAARGPGRLFRPGDRTGGDDGRAAGVSGVGVGGRGGDADGRRGKAVPRRRAAGRVPAGHPDGDEGGRAPAHPPATGAGASRAGHGSRAGDGGQGAGRVDRGRRVAEPAGPAGVPPARLAEAVSDTKPVRLRINSSAIRRHRSSQTTPILASTCSRPRPSALRGATRRPADGIGIPVPIPRESRVVAPDNMCAPIRGELPRKGLPMRKVIVCLVLALATVAGAAGCRSTQGCSTCGN